MRESSDCAAAVETAFCRLKSMDEASRNFFVGDVATSSWRSMTSGSEVVLQLAQTIKWDIPEMGLSFRYYSGQIISCQHNDRLLLVFGLNAPSFLLHLMSQLQSVFQLYCLATASHTMPLFAAHCSQSPYIPVSMKILDVQLYIQHQGVSWEGRMAEWLRYWTLNHVIVGSSPAIH